MSEAIKKIGLNFREKREEMHLSLKEVENATSIRMMYLQAIEEGHINRFISPIYALGFIKQYGAFLGFDADRIIKDNHEAFKKLKPQKQEFLYGLGTLDHRGSNSHDLRHLPNIMWIVVGGVALTAAYFFAKLIGVF